MCTHIMIDGEAVPMDAEMQKKYNDGQYHGSAVSGVRSLGSWVRRGATGKRMLSCAYPLPFFACTACASHPHYQRPPCRAAYESLGAMGERVLGFAYREMSELPMDYEFTNKPEPNFVHDVRRGSASRGAGGRNSKETE